MIGAGVFNKQSKRLKQSVRSMFNRNSRLLSRDAGSFDVAELPDELLDHVAGGGDQPTNTAQQTGSSKSKSTLNNT